MWHGAESELPGERCFLQCACGAICSSPVHLTESLVIGDVLRRHDRSLPSGASLHVDPACNRFPCLRTIISRAAHKSSADCAALAAVDAMRKVDKCTLWLGVVVMGWDERGEVRWCGILGGSRGLDRLEQVGVRLDDVEWGGVVAWDGVGSHRVGLNRVTSWGGFV